MENLIKNLIKEQLEKINKISLLETEKKEIKKKLKNIDEDNWMQKAFGKKEGSLHKALDVPEGEKIPVYKMKKALYNPKLKRKALAAINANPDVYGSLKESVEMGDGIGGADFYKELKPEILKEILKGFLEAALWSSGIEGEFDNYTIYDFSKNTIEESKQIILKFLKEAKEKADDELEFYTPDTLGHNLWLSMNGHGAGFFDDNSDKLQDIARKIREKDLYVGDDNKVWF